MPLQLWVQAARLGLRVKEVGAQNQDQIGLGQVVQFPQHRQSAADLGFGADNERRLVGGRPARGGGSEMLAPLRAMVVKPYSPSCGAR